MTDKTKQEDKYIDAKLSRLQAEEFIRDMIAKYGPDAVLSSEKAAEEVGFYLSRLHLYRMKLDGMVWFDGELPIVKGAAFLYITNPDINNMGDISPEHAAKPRKYLVRACKAMKKPVWAGGVERV